MPEEQVENFYQKNIKRGRETNWRALVLLLAIGILVDGGVFYYQAQAIKSSEEIINGVVKVERQGNTFPAWQTYTNEEFGFEFQYPGEWESTLTLLGPVEGIKPEERPRNVSLYSPNETQESGPGVIFYINPSKSVPNCSISESGPVGSERITKNIFALAGRINSLIKEIYLCSPSGQSTYRFVAIMQKEDTLDDIISTFRFLD